MGEMKNGSHKHFFDYSYLTNFIEDITKALIYVHDDWRWDEPVNSFKTISEPATAIWKMTLRQEILCINIKKYADLESTDYKEEVQLEFGYYEFLEAYITSMKTVLHKYGLLGYRKEWGYDFPMSLLVKVMDISKKSDRIWLKEISAADNFGTEACSTDIQIERAYIDELLEEYVSPNL